MCAAPIGLNADISRGKRLAEEVKKIGTSSETPAARSRLLGIEDSKYRRYELGANIPNELLAKIADLGGDVNFILTGKPSRSNMLDNSELKTTLNAMKNFAECVRDTEKERRRGEEGTGRMYQPLEKFKLEVEAEDIVKTIESIPSALARTDSPWPTATLSHFANVIKLLAETEALHAQMPVRSPDWDAWLQDIETQLTSGLEMVYRNRQSQPQSNAG